MGITSASIKLIERALESMPEAKSIIELGSQNLYLDGQTHEKPPFASTWYEARGLSYLCIDLAGDNNAWKIDLSSSDVMVGPGSQVDLVTDFGTSEHVVVMRDGPENVSFLEGHINSIYPKTEPHEWAIQKGYYNCWNNKHRLLKNGGVMVNENPKTGNWPGHGYTYIDMLFYKELARLMRYEIILLDEQAAMGNTTDGWNVCCILRKKDDQPFIDMNTFLKLPLYCK